MDVKFHIKAIFNICLPKCTFTLWTSIILRQVKMMFYPTHFESFLSFFHFLHLSHRWHEFYRFLSKTGSGPCLHLQSSLCPTPCSTLSYWNLRETFITFHIRVFTELDVLLFLFTMWLQPMSNYFTEAMQSVHGIQNKCPDHLALVKPIVCMHSW